MSKLVLIGIMPAAQKTSVRGGLTDCIIVDAAGWAAVLQKPVKGIALSKRKSLTNRLMQLQTGLETLARQTPILPAHFGTLFGSSEEVEAFLIANSSAIGDAFDDYGNTWQFQIEVRWKPEEALATLSSCQLQTMPQDPKSIADTLASALETERQRLTDQMEAILQPNCMQLASLPVLDETEVARFVALIDRSNETSLDAAVEAVDALASDLFTIRYLGPLPACSFASISCEQVSLEALTDAERILAISPGANATTIQKAFRNKVRQEHPDAKPGLRTESADMSTTRQARDLLLKAGEMRTALNHSNYETNLPALKVHRDLDAGADAPSHGSAAA